MRNGDTLSFVVREKKPLGRLARAERIPKDVDGFTTDVLRVDGELAPAFLARELPKWIGSGSGIYSSADQRGTVACTSRAPNGRPHLLTSLHVAPPGTTIWALEDGQPTFNVGTSVNAQDTVAGGLLYGSNFPLAGEPFSVHASAIAVDLGVPLRPGLHSGQPFHVVPASLSLGWVKDVQLFSVGIGTGVLRTGRAVLRFPRFGGRQDRGLLLVQQTPRSASGDSGGLWYANHADSWFGLGIHRGRSRQDGVAHAFVTDLDAALRLLDLQPGLPGVA